MPVIKMHSTYIEIAQEGYEVLLLDSPIISHLIQKRRGQQRVDFVRVDSDHIDNLIKKEKIPFLNYLMKSKKD
jgi:molecular chaperone HtpG